MDVNLDYNKIKLMYLINFFKVIILDYDNHYLELMKNALKYGMTKQEFWFDDLREYYVYEEAYIEKLHETSHIQGLYSYIALQTVAGNVFQKKGEKPLEYPITNIYAQEKEKTLVGHKKTLTSSVKVTKENLQEVYMNKLAKCY